MNKLHNVEDSQHLKDLLLQKKEAGKIDEDTYNQILASMESAQPSEAQKAFNYVEEVLMTGIKNENDTAYSVDMINTSRPNEYRTKAKSDTNKITYPKNLATPTIDNFQNAISLFQEGYAYLYPCVDISNLKFQNGKLFLNGSEPLRTISEVELQNFRTKESITKIDGLPILRAYYSILLANYELSIRKKEKLFKIFKLYVPDLAKFLKLDKGINQSVIDSIMSQFHSFDNVMGVMHITRNGHPDKSYFPVLSFLGYDAETNTIEIASPYLSKVIERIYKAAIILDKKNQQMKTDNSGKPLLKPMHSYLIRPEIVKERNQAAIENVFIIVTLIEQTGNGKKGKGENIPHIKASNIIERNPQLKQRLEETNLKYKNQLLKRVFKKTWELLRTATNLYEVYKDIQLPDPNNSDNIPKMKNLDLVFNFPHKGKH